MIKNNLKNIAAALLVTVALAAPMSVKAADDTTTSGTTAAATATPKAKKPKTLPIKGAVKAVDKTASTFTVGETTLTVSDTTKFSGGKFDDLAVGTKVTGSYTKDGDKNNAVSVTIAKAKASATPKAKAKASASPAS